MAVASSLKNAAQLLESIRAGRKDIHFIEVMTCPGGCIAGGGQPLNGDQNAIKARMQALYQIDRDETLRVSHKNEDVARLYKEFLGAPLGNGTRTSASAGVRRPTPAKAPSAGPSGHARRCAAAGRKGFSDRNQVGSVLRDLRLVSAAQGQGVLRFQPDRVVRELGPA